MLCSRIFLHTVLENEKRSLNINFYKAGIFFGDFPVVQSDFH